MGDKKTIFCVYTTHFNQNSENERKFFKRSSQKLLFASSSIFLQFAFLILSAKFFFNQMDLMCVARGEGNGVITLSFPPKLSIKNAIKQDFWHKKLKLSLPSLGLPPPYRNPGYATDMQSKDLKQIRLFFTLKNAKHFFIFI